MSRDWSKIRKQAAVYGVALSALAGAEVAEGAVVKLTPNPGTVAFNSNTYVTLAPAGFSFYQYNDGLGKSLSAKGASITGFVSVAGGSLVTTGMAFTANPYFATSASGTAFLGFHTTSNQLGWLHVDLGGSHGPVTYLGAAYENSPGSPIPAGAPEPGTIALFGLGLLALGARGIRKLREREAEAEAS